jgi:integrase-like protein
MTSPYCSVEVVAGYIERHPTAEVHAKMVGTTTAVCGAQTTSWYTAEAFRTACGRCGITQSMGRVGSALDNAVIESWHSTLEFELRQLEHFTTRARTRRRLAIWIEEYNHDRRHPRSGCVPRSPTSSPSAPSSPARRPSSVRRPQHERHSSVPRA